ncbi:MAG: hypothetical protein KGS47_02850 [Chloroflexi bacterium]|nr:hypothetical protein [Chloroflexota bacterium]
MNICVFGCKSTTLLLSRHLLDIIGISALVTIDPVRGQRADVADYCDIREWAEAHRVPVYSAARYDLKASTDQAFFAAQRFDIGFVMGWQRLIPDAILSTFSLGVFGMHGSAANLPIGRGRSPMNWALLEGRQVFYTNLFRYDPGVDSGDILDTLCFTINSSDTAETLHFKNTLSMIALIRRNVTAFQSKMLNLVQQPADRATYYPKRTPDASLIDWDAPIDNIERFIRAVAPPFNGAFSYINTTAVSITRAAIFEFDAVPLIGPAPRGQIVEVFPNGKFLVRCSGGTLIIHEYHGIDRTAITPGVQFHSHDRTLGVFPRNRHGGHDLPEASS